MGTGSTIRWKEKVCSNGRTARSILGTIRMISSMGMVHSFGPTVAHILVSGRMEFSMVKAYLLRMEESVKVDGTKVKELNGWAKQSRKHPRMKLIEVIRLNHIFLSLLEVIMSHLPFKFRPLIIHLFKLLVSKAMYRKKS